MNLLEVDPERLKSVLGADDEIGLSSQQAARNLKEFGPNVYSGKLKKPFRFFKRVFSDAIFWIFVLISLYVAIAYPDADITASLFVTVCGYLIFTVGVSLYVDKVLDKVKSFSQVKSRVKRDGKFCPLDSSRVVPGDTLFLERGEIIPCDGIIMKKRYLKVLEANVTGKCEAVIKRDYHEVCEQKHPYFDCILFAGTVVLSGSATVLVCNTGKNLFDSVNSNVKRSQGQMPAVHSVAKRLGKYLSLIWIPACFLIFAVGVLAGKNIFDMFYYALVPVIAAMPESVRLLSELCVAMQVSSLMKRGVILKNYAAIDKLSSVNCISVHSDSFMLEKNPVVGSYLVDDCPYQFSDRPKYSRELLEYMMVCCTKTSPTWNRRAVDPAIINACRSLGLKQKRSEKALGVFTRYDYDPKIGFSAVLCSRNNSCRFIVKGSPESVIPRCGYLKKERETVFINETQKLRLMDTARGIAVGGEYVTALAVLDVSDALAKEFPACLQNMTFLGFVGVYTPVRAAAAEAVNRCVKDGIDVLLITSDSKHSGFGLAKGLGMIGPGDKQFAMDDAEYNKVDRGLFIADLDKYKVFCGLDPANQRDLVRLRNSSGDVTASVTDSLDSSIAQSEADVSFAYAGSKSICVRHNADVLLSERGFEGVYGSVKAAGAIRKNIESMLVYSVFIQALIAVLTFFSLGFFGTTVVSPCALILFGLCLGECAVLSIAAQPPVQGGACLKRKSYLLCGGVAACCAVLCSLATLIAYRTVFYYTSIHGLSQSCAAICLFASAFFVRFSLKASTVKPAFNLWDGVGSAVGIAAIIFLVVIMPSVNNNIKAIPDLVTVIIALVCALCGAALSALVGVFAFKQDRTGKNKIERS